MSGFKIKKPENNNNSGERIDMVPPTQVLEDGTIEIIDWVKGVELISYKRDGNNDIFTFKETKTGAIKQKYIEDPNERGYITKLDEGAKKDQLLDIAFNEYTTLFKSFIIPYEVDNILEEYQKGIDSVTSEGLSTHLIAVVKEGSKKNQNEVWLRLTFKDSEGVEPKYIIPREKYLGNEKFHPDFFVSKTDEKYSHKKNFTVLEKQADFTTPNMNPITVPTMEPTSFVFPDSMDTSSTLNTPDVDLLS